MSISLATKGIIAQFAPSGGGYPVYTPMEEPELKTDEMGFSDIRIKELKPWIKIDFEE